MKRLAILLALAISTPATALTIDLKEHPFGTLTAYNPSDTFATLYFTGGGVMSYPTDPYARSVYYISVGGGSAIMGGMTICNVIGFYHDPCEMTMPSGTGWISLDPGVNELSYSGVMAYSPVSVLLSASLTIDDKWFRSPPYVDEALATVPVPGAVWLFSSIVAIFGGARQLLRLRRKAVA